jgi:DNA-binding NtrC family response regulator
MENLDVECPLSPADRFGDAIGRSTAMRRVFGVLERASASDASIVFEGESGTGKELLARGVHQSGGRRSARFVVLEVEAFSPVLIESELFGRAPPPGAPKAASRTGALEEAHGGTLVVDQVDALPLVVQARLARVLEQAQDVRIIATSRNDLEESVRAGRFRQDLFYRLTAVRVRVPALRERVEDIPLLARHFQSRMKGCAPISSVAMELLTRLPWPGNVRELRTAIERMSALPDLGPRAVHLALVKPTLAEGIDPRPPIEMIQKLVALPYHEAKQRVLESFERSYLAEHLRLADGIITHAANRAGLPRQSVHRMIRRLGLTVEPDAESKRAQTG